ncbi:hypothetical protein CHS0354_028179 [Potamilus streckersoni]|uniref:Uncharacterized protein n=1 Tax=Potamilus streckersoni TaxID=2493646 RepID=A0AAE0TI32_9BIVA|nr:hypothetical protein CHS0354_028179 [Potamilus streckersoni]
MSVMSSCYLQDKWGGKYIEFIDAACISNGTLLLHIELMNHCDVGLLIAEIIGGTHGYNLQLSTVNASLLFAFVNGAASLRKFYIHLLCEHVSAGYFCHQPRASLFATPNRGSDTNFSLNSQREIDHRDALKSFRPSAALEAIPRMSILVSASIFFLTEHEMPRLDNIGAPKVLIQSVKAGKSVTIKRAKYNPQKTDVTTKQEN